MIRPAPFRSAAPPNLPAGQVYRPGFLRRSLAYVANGDRPPMFTFGNVPSCNVPENQRQSAVMSHRADTALRACIVACSALFMACAGLAVTL